MDDINSLEFFLAKIALDEIFAFIAHPNLIAISMVFSFKTGKTPGKPRSTKDAWLFCVWPNFVGALEKILDSVDNWTWTSNPITDSQVLFIMKIAILLEFIRKVQ